MNAAFWLNTAWMMSCAGEARAFRRATCRVRRAQEERLRHILRENRYTWYGRQFKFAKIRTVQDYQQQVPLADYDRFCPPIHRIASGESGVLTKQQVLLLEPTGGSTSGEKLIPYTSALRSEFQRALAAWIFDLMRHLPAVRRGRAYWSISPMACESRTSEGGVPIGFEDDRDYLAAWQRWAVSRLLVVPPQIRQLRSHENARYVTLLYLLACADLAVISIWSPTFLTALLTDLPPWWEAICADLRAGCARLPLPSAEGGDFLLPLPRAHRRADKLRGIFAGSQDMSQKLNACWPRLALVSCWADASSAMYVPLLRAAFPKAVLQPKGLLATEGVVSFPLVGAAKGSVLAVRSHFFEFVAARTDEKIQSQEIRLADELEVKGHYRVVLTTGGGLYRYDLGDEIEVVGFYNSCPLIRFLGRHDAVSDLVGEKLHEQHVRTAIDKTCDDLDVAPQFALLAPTRERPARYRLYLQCGRGDERTLRQRLAERLEEHLRENPQYRTAVTSGQLHPVDVHLVQSNAWKLYQYVCLNRGQKLGDIKPTSLDAWTGWEDVLGNRGKWSTRQ